MAKKKELKGATGAYQGRNVEVTQDNGDGTVNLQGLDPNTGKDGAGNPTTNPNPWTAENVPVDQVDLGATVDDDTPPAE
jgi:hypothetical protein